MKKIASVFALSAISVALVSGAAYAQDDDVPMGFAAKTRNEIYHANEASRSGAAPSALGAAVDPSDRIAGFAGRTPRELFPGNYPQAKSTLTREQVREELRAAQEAGDIRVSFVGKTQAELFPSQVHEDKALRTIASQPTAPAR